MIHRDYGVFNRLCFALDVEGMTRALRFIDLLPMVGTFKVGLELFISEGPKMVEMVKQSKAKCFLDLKLHDIPETVSRAVKRGVELGADFMTVHASGGKAMVQAAVEATKDSNTKILSVTALTSLDDHDCTDVYGVNRDYSVRRLMELANQAGTHGFVCSAKEVDYKKFNYPDKFFLIPGIRPAGSVTGDQKAIGTPQQAIQGGADLLVVGRPIRDAQDPAKAAEAILDEIERVMKE